VTNTLHRTGPAGDFGDDFILFAMCTRGQNDEGAPERLRRFLEICARHHPVNLGDAKQGGRWRPSPHLTPLAHWRREEPDASRRVIEGIAAPTTASAVFDTIESLTRAVAEVRDANLGLSINIAAVTSDARASAEAAGIQRHAVEYSLGFLGDTGRLPDADTLALTTMCGHGMVAAAFAQKMIDWVRTDRRTPAQCARYMARFCVCGIFNTVRAERLLCRMAGAAHRGAPRAEDRRPGPG
jgi:hypothetical protein